MRTDAEMPVPRFSFLRITTSIAGLGGNHTRPADFYFMRRIHEAYKNLRSKLATSMTLKNN